MLKFIRAKGAQNSAEKTKIQKDLFQCQQTIQHGFPNKPTALAWDPVLRLMAIGTKAGAIKIFGQPGVEFYGYHVNVEATILRILFVPGQGRLVSVCDDNSIHLWEVNGHSLEEVKTYELETKTKKISACAVDSDGSTLFFGTESGNVYQIDLTTFDISEKVIYQETVLQKVKEIYQKNPGPVECILEFPDDSTKLIVGYNKGLLVQWNKEKETTEKVWSINQQLECVAWKKSGEELVSSHNDGSFVRWYVKKKEEQLDKKISNPYGPFPCKAITKIFAAEGETDDWIVFSGGMPRASYGDHNTVSVIHGEDQHVTFDFTSKVIDFFTVASENGKDLAALVVLAEEELVSIDLSSEGWPIFHAPYLAPLHSSAVTAQLVATITDALYQKLLAIGEKQLAVGKYSSKSWPIDGGEPGEVDVPPHPLVLLTGHEDGSLHIWDVTGPALKHILKYSTAPLFTGDDFESGEAVPEEGEEEWPPFRKVGVFDPYSDDPRLAVKKLAFCPTTGLVIIGGTAGQIVTVRLEDQDGNDPVKTLTLSVVSDRDSFVWKGHSKLEVKAESLKQSAGYKAKSVVQIHPPAAVTCLALHSEWGLVAVGTAHGIGLVDILQVKGVISKCTLTATDMSAAGDHPMSRRKSFKKSLRESFRRLRKGRSQINVDRKGATEKGGLEEEKTKEGLKREYSTDPLPETPVVEQPKKLRSFPIRFSSGHYGVAEQESSQGVDRRQLYRRTRSREGSIEVASAMLSGPPLEQISDIIERPHDPLAAVLYEGSQKDLGDIEERRRTPWYRGFRRGSSYSAPSTPLDGSDVKKRFSLERLLKKQTSIAEEIAEDTVSESQVVRISRFKILKTQSLEGPPEAPKNETSEEAPLKASRFFGKLTRRASLEPAIEEKTITPVVSPTSQTEETIKQKRLRFPKLVSFRSVDETAGAKWCAGDRTDIRDAGLERQSVEMPESEEKHVRLRNLPKFLSLHSMDMSKKEAMPEIEPNTTIDCERSRSFLSFRRKNNPSARKQDESSQKEKKTHERLEKNIPRAVSLSAIPQQEEEQKFDPPVGKEKKFRFSFKREVSRSSPAVDAASGELPERRFFSFRRPKRPHTIAVCPETPAVSPVEIEPTGRRPLKFSRLNTDKFKILPRLDSVNSIATEFEDDPAEGGFSQIPIHSSPSDGESEEPDIVKSTKKLRMPEWYWTGVSFDTMDGVKKDESKGNNKQRHFKSTQLTKSGKLVQLRRGSKKAPKEFESLGSLTSVRTGSEWFVAEEERSPFSLRHPLNRSFEYIDASPSALLSSDFTPDTFRASSVELLDSSLTSLPLCRAGSHTPASPPPAEARPVERQIEARSTDDSMSSMVRCLYLSSTYIVNADTASPTLWAGTNSGAVFIFTISVPQGEKRAQVAVTSQLAKEIQLRHKAPVISIGVVDATYTPLPEPGEVAAGLARTPEVSAPHRLVICSEEQFKIFTLPNLRPFGKFKLTALEGARVRKIAIVRFSSADGKHGENCLVCLTNLGELSIFSLPDLRRQINVSCIRREDIHGISSLVLAKNAEAFYMQSSSEIQRIALSAHDHLRLRCRLELPEGLRARPKTPVKEETVSVAVESKPEASPVKKVASADSLSARLTNGILEESKSSIPEGDFSIGDITIDSVRDHLAANLDESKSSMESRFEKMSISVSSSASQRVTETVQVIKTKTSSTGETVVSTETVTMESNNTTNSSDN